MTSVRLVRAAAWFVALFGVIVALRAAGTGDLAAPSLSSIDALAAWADTRTPAVMAIAVVRVGAEAAAWYLLGLSVLHVLGHIRGLHPVRGLTETLSVAGSQRVLYLALGLTAATSAQWTGANETSVPAVVVEADTSQVVEWAAPSLPGSVDLRPTSGRASMAPLGPVTTTGAGTATMRPLAPHTTDPAVAPTPGVARMVPNPTMVTDSEPQEAPPQLEHWTVGDGESFWSIAGQILAAGTADEPDTIAHDRYWRALIDANRDRLAEPENPDLIYPGQVFVVPPPPGR